MKLLRSAAGWRAVNGLALGFSLAHFLMDWHIGLFGASSDDITALQAALVWASALLYGWWAFALSGATHASRTSLATLAVFAGGWGLAGNGLVIFACLPPCQGAFPHQDIAHLGSLVFGALATMRAIGGMRAASGKIGWNGVVGAAGLVAVVFTLEAVLAPL